MSATLPMVSRRDFMRFSGMAAAAGLTLGYTSTGSAKDTILSRGAAEARGISLTTWVTIAPSGLVTLVCHRAEMGQGAVQAIPQIIAEELEVELDAIEVVFATGHQGKFGSQITGGSSTVRSAYPTLLRTGATAREMLITTAADRWRVDRSACHAASGRVIHASSGRSFSYGALVEDAAKLEPPAEVKLKDRSDYKLIGASLPRRDTPAKCNGTAVFGQDFTLPGLLYAVVERNPRFQGKVKSFDASRAKAVRGVKHVIKVQMPVFSTTREGVAVIADSVWTAMKARKLLSIEWDDSGFEHLSTEQLFQRMREDLKKPGLSHSTRGNFEAAYERSERKLTAVYETPYQAHACMETLNCTAHVEGDRVQVWGPIQAPDWIQKDLSERLNVPTDNVIVHMTYLGGGFGRKAFTDYTAEAALLSKAVKAPVQVVWTREDDISQGPFRPAAMYQCDGALDEKGRITAFRAKIATHNFDPNADKSAFNPNATEGLAEQYLHGIRNSSFADVPTESPIPMLWWRSVYSSTNAFAFESFVDELAVAAKSDPLEFRRTHLESESGRYIRLIDTLKQKSGWSERAANSGWGVAITECFGSTVGQVVKVSRRGERGIQIDKVIVVMDCGWYVNPDIIRAQVEGSIVMALGAATLHAIHFTDGKAVETNFHNYALPRLADVPPIEIHIMENDEKAGGVGEPALPTFAPALCNAIFDLTGVRQRKLPIDLTAI
jgi:isoquinoline 1-oxidoreductase beta subunit